MVKDAQTNDCGMHGKEIVPTLHKNGRLGS